MLISDIKITLLLFLVVSWVGWIILQRQKRYPVANKILEDKRHELGEDFTGLAAKVGKGYFYETIKVNGIEYYFGYYVSRPKEINDSDLPGELADAVTIEGYIDCVSVLPWVYLKFGPSFRETIEKRLEMKNA